MVCVPSQKPILIFDGKCGFCRIWIDYWRQLTGDRIEYIALQDVGDRFPQIPAEAYEQSVQLVRPDGTVASGARAVFESLGKLRLYSWVSAPAELAYRLVAGHRNFFYHLTRLTFGKKIEPARFEKTQWLFLRALAVIYAIAFASLANQVMALYGSGGILPITDFLISIARNAGAIRYLAVPSIFWIGSDDMVLNGMCWAGIILSVMLMITGFQSNRFQRAILVLLFLLYLSFSSAGQEFLSFQWDSLLLETGFLAIFLGSNRIIPWMFRWLCFRLYFLSGAVKLLSGDKTWRSLTALDFHYHTQPLPTPLAWYMDKLPPALQRWSTAGVLGAELVLPFLIFFPRRIRMFAATCMIALQILILLTGNYTFFNLLAIALCLFLYDDRVLGRFAPATSWRIKPSANSQIEAHEDSPAPSSGRLAKAVAVLVLALGLSRHWLTFTGSVPAPVAAMIRYTAPLQIVNTYGLFAVMTTTRNEIVLEGSDDGQNWKEYEFRYKPGDVRQAPRWVAPYQPRMDWQMWFAALGNYQSNPWLVNYVVRLLEGSDQANSLLAANPFPAHPPKFIRAIVYEYTFTNFAERRSTHAWWKRELRGQYLPAVGLRSGAQPSGNQ
jgi:lipase maturation factor 1